MDNEKIIARIARNESDELLVRSGRYWNIDIIDLRWYNNNNPTRKGLRCNMKEARLLLRALQKTIGDVNEDEQKSDEN
ncbi:MAG: hypothetical protein GOVbin140_26 [Prokaryotic dsDNA virus sp.]|jgi:hypothetical protein|nr:MAG: hypothetical protein GOVbin140_26 [Prokaryotic dsDNA virus sp.]|tara:strand:- start:11726 stop:11959 length:234 start_codon:yes stop_codon:yes gene_type:complete